MVKGQRLAIIDLSPALICNADYRMSIDEAKKFLWNADLIEKSETKHKNLLSPIKMGKEIATFGDIEIKKHTFYHYKSPIF